MSRGAMGVSLCMIVKDEAAWIVRALEAHAAFADEAIVVDTGSTDGTPDIARRAGARVESIAWPGDFAAARNASMAFASCEWVLALDADERIEAADFPRLRQIMARDGAVGVQLIQRSYSNDSELAWWRPLTDASVAPGYAGYTDSPLVRLFRLDQRIRFEGVIHEIVEPSLERHGLPTHPSDVVIHHFKEEKSPEAKAAKTSLYLDLCREKTRRWPRDVKAWLELGQCAYDARRYDLAAEALRGATGLAPSSESSLALLGGALLRGGRPAEAAEVFTEAMGRCGRGGELLSGMGEALLDLGRTDEASAAFEECLGRDPNHFRATLNLGVCHLRRQRSDRAAALFERARRINPASDLADLNEGILAREAGDRDRAAALFERALGHDPSRWQNWMWVGQVAFDGGDYERALDRWEHGARCPGPGADLYVKLCSACAALRRFDDARAHARRAADMDARHTPILEMLPPATTERQGAGPDLSPD